MDALTARACRFVLTLSMILALSACGFVDSGGSQGVDVGSGGSGVVNERALVIIDAAAVTNIDEDAAYNWTQVGGPAVELMDANTTMASFIAPSVDQRTVLVFALTKTDAFGASDTGQVEITVNNGPEADAGDDRTGIPRTRIALNGGHSTDTDGVIAAYLWHQTSGPPAASPAGFDTAQPSFVVPSAPLGTILAFRVTVTDNDGAAASDAANLTVRAASPGPGPGPFPSPRPKPCDKGDNPRDDDEEKHKDKDRCGDKDEDD